MTKLLNVTPTVVPDTVVPASTPWMNSEGDFGEGVPEKIQGLLEKKKWTNINQLADGFTELESYKGIASGKHIVLPESVDDIDGWDKVFTAIGKPESADKYEFTNETGIELSDDLMNGFKEFAHKANYTQEQLTGAIQFQLEAIKAGDELYTAQQVEHKTENIDAMKQKWQTDYEPTMTKIDSTAEKLGVKAYFEKMGIDKEPEIVNMLLTIANSDSEDILNTNGEPPPAPTTLQDKLAEIMKSEEYNQRFNPGHKAKMQEFMELNQEIANSGHGRAPQ